MQQQEKQIKLNTQTNKLYRLIEKLNHALFIFPLIPRIVGTNYKLSAAIINKILISHKNIEIHS